MSYFWEDEVLYRQPSTDGELEPRIPLARNVSSSADVSFSVTESEHPSNRFSTERLLTAKMTSTIDAGFLGTIAETTTLTVELRPEQSDVLDYLYFYLHNTPPVADTLSQLDLPLDQVKPTSSTLYNYDTNRDAQPGLAVVASDAVGETDPTKYQNWVTDALATTTIDGRMSLYLASAAANFATDGVESQEVV